MIQKRSKVLWFTGLSGSGKTTIAEGTYQHLIKNGKKVKILDGDKIRGEIHYNLGFTKMDIEKNNKKIAELCIDLISSYDFIIVPIISPFSYLRKKVRAMIGLGFYEIYIQASLTKVINRDVKGLYKKALRNEINNFSDNKNKIQKLFQKKR